MPLTEVSLQNFQTKATNTGCSILDVTHASDLADMMLIEFANRNMQTAIGNGISSHNRKLLQFPFFKPQSIT